MCKIAQKKKDSVKFSYRADTDNRKKLLSADTDMVADILCIPNLYIYIYRIALPPMFKTWLRPCYIVLV